MPDILVQSFTHLKDMPRAETALEMLKKTASLVKPIMRKHGWVLPVLTEFFPDNPNLLGLNVNMGQQILVRLRYPHSPDAFLPQEDVVGTMLHELTHNVHGPHDDKFYKYLAGLQDEYDDLQRSGYAGEGFFSEGRRLGQNISHNAPQHVGRSKALEAAEKRRQNSRVLGTGGNRLGGSGRNVGLTPREMAARAAEQRTHDEKSCASGADAQRESDKAAKGSIESKVIDLTLDDQMTVDRGDSGYDSDIIIVEDVKPLPTGHSNAKAGPSKTTTSTVTKKVRNSSSSARYASSSRNSTPPAPPLSKQKEWSCPACTFLNQQTSVQCSICETPKHVDKPAVIRVAPVKPPVPALASKKRLDSSKILPSKDWSCQACTLFNPHDLWSCSACGAIKAQS